jgi:xylulokinase
VTRSCVLGIDLGTSALKLLAVSPEGRLLATAREPYETITKCEGKAEQKCEDWLKALSRAAARIHSRARLQIEAIGITGQMPTLVVLSGTKPLDHAITWQDSRADSWASQRLNKEFRQDIYRRTGVIIDGRYLAPMFAFHHASQATRFLSAKDFLFFALTGAFTTDPSTASGYGLYSLKSNSWDGELCSFWKISAAQLPSIMSSLCSIPLSTSGSKIVGCAPGTPVSVGCADSAAGVYALGGNRPQTDAVHILTGTSTVLIKCDSDPHWDAQGRYLITPLAVDHSYGREADLLASGSAREWAQNLFTLKSNNTRRSFWQSAHEIAPGADGLLFAPYLAGGEQGVLWNPDLKGSLVGLTCSHGAAHIARALLEGMGFEARRCVEVFEDKPITAVRVTGWITQSPAELQILTDILGKPVHAVKVESASAMGAALMTGRIDFDTYFANTKARVLEPTNHTHRYNESYARYLVEFPANYRD